MSMSESRSELVMELAEEFLARYRRGERPPIREYIDRHPELAAEIKDVFPAMAMMENIAVADDSLEGSPEPEKSKPVELTFKQLGDFRIIREIGHGGMGIVYEAEQVSLGRHVALKVLPNQALQDAKQKRRFEREARAAAKLHHTNIVPVFGVGEHEGMPYYVMQFIQGLGLDAVLDELNRLQPGQAKTPAYLPTATDIRVPARDVSAAVMARSLMTGTFQPTDEEIQELAAEKHPSFAQTMEFNPGQADEVPENGTSDKDRIPILRAPAPSTQSGRLSDSFTLSSSSITLPGTSSKVSGDKSITKKQTYWQSVANIGRQVADALEYAHRQGVLHRDVKPSNLLLDMRGTVWVTDFGLAKVAGPGADNLTHTGDILGTLRYMPPEAFEGRSDARSDVYSLGLTLYELLAKRPAFDEKERNKLIKQVTSGEPTRLDKVNREIPRDLVTIIQKSIEREPVRRYSTAEELAADLNRFIEDEPILARRQSQLERYVRWARHHPGIAVMGGVLTAVLILVTIGSLIIAGRMTSLARNEAQAAVDERTARTEAVAAQKREALEREQAEAAKKAAEESKQRAEKALQKAEENYSKARAAVNDYLTAITEDDRLKAPGLQGLRVQLLQSALQFYQEFLTERGNDPSLRRELARVYYKIGEIYQDLGQSATATQSYTQAHRLYENLTTESPQDPELQYGLAMSLFRIGATTQAIPILEKLIRPDDPKYHAELGDLYHAVANSADEKSNPTIVLEYLRKSLTVRERLVRLSPDDAEARVGLGGSYNNIAIRLKKDKLDEALSLIRRSVEQSEAAYRLRPAHLQTVRYLLVGLNNVANWAKQAGDIDLALSAHRRRIDILDRRARDNPNIAGFEMELVEGYTNLVAELTEASRWEEANKIVEKARFRFTELSEETPEFFFGLAEFQFVTYALSLAHTQAEPTAKVNLDQNAANVVIAFRQILLASMSSESRGNPKESSDMLTRLFSSQRNDIATSLLIREDFQVLMTQIGELFSVMSFSSQVNAPEERINGFQKAIPLIETLAKPLMPARFVRRILAEVRQEWAQALLQAGRLEEARVAFDEALTERQQLVQEAPSNEKLRSDLAQSQSAAGDLYATAGKLADANKAWEHALNTLEDGLKRDTNSLLYRTALSKRLTHIGNQYGKLGLWDIAAKHYARAFQIQAPTELVDWFFYGMLLGELGDSAEFRKHTEQIIERLAIDKSFNFLHVSRILLLTPENSARYPDAIKRIAKEINHSERNWTEWCKGLAAIRLGEPEKALTFLEQLRDPIQKLPVQALALHQIGQTEAAKNALQQADALVEEKFREILPSEQLMIPDRWWSDWLLFQILRREAHLTIHKKPLPDSPYERLYKGRLLLAFGDADRAEAEFTNAIKVRPQDAKVWLSRSHVFAKLNRKERMTADLLKAQQLQGEDPKTWIETARMLAERGEHAQADKAYARAASLGKGELNRFLESGWWVIGPYPKELETKCPPERNPDPSSTLPSVDYKRDLKWQSVIISPHTGSIHLPNPIGGQSDATSYALNYVYSESDRTAIVHLWPKSDARVWINGNLIFSGFGTGKGTIIQIPVTLRKGRNTILIKNQHQGPVFCECAFIDAPVRQGYELVRMGLWAEAATALADADQRAPLHEYPMRLWLHCLFALGRHEEAQKVFALMLQRYDNPGVSRISPDVPRACLFPPEQNEARNRWIAAIQETQSGDTDTQDLFWIANAHYRAGRFSEAENLLRKARVQEQLYYLPLLASILHQQGKKEEARKILKDLEEKHASLVKKALTEKTFALAQYWEFELQFQALRREARTLILGKDSGASTEENILHQRAFSRYAELNNNADAYTRLIDIEPNVARHWVEQGRRLGELKQWEAAAKAFEKAVQMQPKDERILQDIATIYTDLGKWDEAVTYFVKALEVRPVTSSYWFANHPAFSVIARNKDVFQRMDKQRPKDRQLWIARVHYLARTAQWAEASQACEQVTELDPTDRLSWHFQATFHLYLGDTKAYQKDCQEMFSRFADSTDPEIAQQLATTCFLGPNGTEDPAPLIDRMIKLNPKQANLGWNATTLGLGHYRQDSFEKASIYLFSQSRGTHMSAICALAVLAMSHQKQEETEEAQSSLELLRFKIKRLSNPGPDEVQPVWWNWLHCQILFREAEALIPATTVAANSPATTSQEYIIQQARKVRAERLEIQAALAQISFDVGKKSEAEAELRNILSERTKLANEEPENHSYQADLVSTHAQLAYVFINVGRYEEGFKYSKSAIDLLNKLDAKNTRAERIRVALAANFLAGGDSAKKANRPGEAIRLYQLARDQVLALSKSAKQAMSPIQQANAEYQVGELYAGFGLLKEAAEQMDVDKWPADTDLWLQIRAGELRQLNGKPDSLKQVGVKAYQKYAKTNNQWTMAALVVANGIPSEGTIDPNLLLKTAQAATRGTGPDDGRWLQLAISEYRAGRYQDAVQHAETPQLRETRWAMPILALSYHKLGDTVKAKEWLARAQAHLASHFRNRAMAPELEFDSRWETLLDILCLTREAHQLIEGKPLPMDPMERFTRARAYLLIGMKQQAEEELKLAPAINSTDPAVLLSWSRIKTTFEQPEEAKGLLTKAQQLAEAALVKRTDDAVVADTLASLLSVKIRPEWNVLKPLKVVSENGTTLSALADDSVLASGLNPDEEVYVFEGEFDGLIKSIKLEAIPDESMPRGGCGRAGNFVLTDFKVFAGNREIRLLSASADFSQLFPSDLAQHHPVALAIDADPNTGWAVFPRISEPHWAIFTPASQFGEIGKTRITIRLSFKNKDWKKQALGRFRISVSGDSDIDRLSTLFKAVSSAHAKFAMVYFSRGEIQKAKEFITKSISSNAKPQADDWLVLALIHSHLAEKDEARKSLIKAVEQIRATNFDSVLRPLIQEVLSLMGTQSPEAAQLLAISAGDPPSALNEAIRQNPKQSKGYRERGNWYGSRGRWKEAIADLKEVVAIDSTSYDAMQLAAMLAHTGETEKYQELCKKTLEIHKNTNLNNRSEQVLKLCLLLPDHKLDPKLLARLATVSISGDKNQDWYDYYLFCKALHDYRAGKFTDALANTQEIRQLAPQTKGSFDLIMASALVVEAMSLKRTGDITGAQAALKEVKTKLNQHVPGFDASWWHDWLIVHILFREAEQVVNEKPTPVVEKKK